MNRQLVGAALVGAFVWIGARRAHGRTPCFHPGAKGAVELAGGLWKFVDAAGRLVACKDSGCNRVADSLCADADDPFGDEVP